MKIIRFCWILSINTLFLKYNQNVELSKIECRTYQFKIEEQLWRTNRQFLKVKKRNKFSIFKFLR